MNKQLGKRIVIGLMSLALVLGGYRAWQSYIRDPGGIGSADTEGMIAAIEYSNGGSRAVVIQRDGSVAESGNYRSGVNDREIVWQPDGNRIFFSSDRNPKDGFQIFRWKPGRDPEQLTSGSRSKSNLWFGPPGDPLANERALVTQGGFVQEFVPADKTTSQLLPPVEKNRSNTTEGGAGGQMDALYARLGSSFKEAKWTKDRNWILAVMSRESGEVLVLQNVKSSAQEPFKPPIAIAAGEKIDFDVSVTGDVVFSIYAFEFPVPEQVPKEFVKNGRAVPPYRHALMLFNPDRLQQEDMKPIAYSPDDQVAFRQPKFSPDGASILLLAGKRTPNSFLPTQLAIVPAQIGGASLKATVASGAIFEPAWFPDGMSIVFVKSEGGKRSIFRIGKDGGDLRNLTGTKGDFGSPSVSPQIKSTK